MPKGRRSQQEILLSGFAEALKGILPDNKISEIISVTKQHTSLNKDVSAVSNKDITDIISGSGLPEIKAKIYFLHRILANIVTESDIDPLFIENIDKLELSGSDNLKAIAVLANWGQRNVGDKLTELWNQYEAKENFDALDELPSDHDLDPEQEVIVELQQEPDIGSSIPNTSKKGFSKKNKEPELIVS